MDDQGTYRKRGKELSLRQQLFIVACATAGTLIGMFGPRIGPEIPPQYLLGFAIIVVAIALAGIYRRRKNARNGPDEK